MKKSPMTYLLITAMPFIISCTSEWKDPVTGMEFVKIPSGCFKMGEDKHNVCIKNDFYMGKYEVTQGQWLKLIGRSISVYMSINHPVDYASFENAQEFIRRLNKQTGKNYRLPTEAEWEYACLSGGKPQIYCGSNTYLTVFWGPDETNHYKHHAVGGKAPNDFGLYDMTGNVSEWTCSGYDDIFGYSENICSDSSKFYSISGGSWKEKSSPQPAITHGHLKLNTALPGLGFRLVMDI